MALKRFIVGEARAYRDGRVYAPDEMVTIDTDVEKPHPGWKLVEETKPAPEPEKAPTPEKAPEPSPDPRGKGKRPA